MLSKGFQNVFKRISKCFQKDFKMFSSKGFQNVFKMISKCFQKDFKVFSKEFQKDFKRILLCFELIFSNVDAADGRKGSRQDKKIHNFYYISLDTYPHDRNRTKKIGKPKFEPQAFSLLYSQIRIWRYKYLY